MHALALALALAASAAGGAAPAEEPLFPVLRDGRWGYIDRAGAVVIPPAFEKAGPFSEGLAAVRTGGKHGYVDRTGKLVLVPAQAPAGEVHRPFRDGRAVVRVGNAFGYVDRTGALAIPARWASADDFSEGLALVCDAALGCGYVDPAGRGRIGPGLMGGGRVRGGVVCAIRMMAMGRQRVAIYRASGELLADDLEGCGTHAEGRIAVRIAGRWGFLDSAGRGVIAPTFEWAGDFGSGLAPVRDDGGRCGYVDAAGRLAIPARFRACGAFAGGVARVDLAAAEGEAERVAFIAPDGRAVVIGPAADPPFDSASDVVDGLAAVGSGGEPFLAGTGPLLGYVAPDGRWVWKPAR